MHFGFLDTDASSLKTERRKVGKTEGIQYK